ncbi:MAG: hypothetical protein ACR2MN_13425 [Acidimicrobiales bacterium]
MDQHPEHCFATMQAPADHAVGLELQIVDVVERSRRARVQGDTAAEAALDAELEGLYGELSNTATKVAVGYRPLQERSVVIEVAADAATVTAGTGFEAKRRVLEREVADLGGVAVCSPSLRRYGARFWVRAPDLAAALDDGIGSFRHAAARAGLPDAPVVRLEGPRSGAV